MPSKVAVQARIQVSIGAVFIVPYSEANIYMLQDRQK